MMFKKLVLGVVLGVASFGALAYYGCDTWTEYRNGRMYVCTNCNGIVICR